MSAEGGAVPMEEDEAICKDPSSADVAPMDWVKVDEAAGSDDSTPLLTQSPKPVGANGDLGETPGIEEFSSPLGKTSQLAGERVLVTPKVDTTSGADESSPAPRQSPNAVGEVAQRGSFEAENTSRVEDSSPTLHQSPPPVGSKAASERGSFKADRKTRVEVSSPASRQSNERVVQSESLPVQLPPDNFDEYSFGSSDDDKDDGSENGEEKLYEPPVSTFDMGILQSSIEGSKDALDLVAGKEVVMVVGKTGVGKSTLIQGIAGKQIYSSFHEASFSGHKATSTVFDAKDALPNFEIGHAKVSKTKSLNAFLRKDGVSELLFLDSPGLNDTRTNGAEMDIATSALLSQVAKRCKCLRFVILIHCASLLEDRGDAFRSVVQFAKKFVQDFSESKRSFMFLFTHTDEITGMSSSSSNAKTRVQEEIIKIAEVTKDEDILAVLKFIRQSLKKDYPFADILHPLSTDYRKLAADIERLHVVSNLTSASSCNLTLSSKMKLEVAIQHLLERLQSALRSSSNSIAEAKEIQTSFRYLRECVDVECVRKAACQSEEIIDDHKKELSRCIESEFARWKSNSSDFEESNALALQRTLLLLQDADENFSAGHWIQSKNDDVVKLQDEIFMKANNCQNFWREFSKLHAWANMFRECLGIHAETCQKVTALFEETLETVSRTNPATLHERSEDQVSLFIESILVLQAMSQFSEQISVPEINLADATSSLEKVLDDFKRVLGSWVAKAAQLAEPGSKDDFNDLASYTRVLESMSEVLSKYDEGVNSNLLPTIESALRSIEQGVIGQFSACCGELISSSFDSSWEPELHWMHNVCKSFANMRSGGWKEMSSSFSVVIDNVKSALYSASGELENMSQVTKEHGMRSGQRLGKELVSFKKSEWFDSYLPQGDTFVANSCIAIELAFQERITEKSAELNAILASLPKEKFFQTESIKKLELLLPELKEIDDFLAVVEELTGPQSQDSEELFGKCESCLEDHARYLDGLAAKCARKWVAKLKQLGNISGTREVDRVCTLAQKLDLIYADARALSMIPSLVAISQKSKRILREISNAIGKFSCIVDSELNHFKGDFQLKANVLTLIKACSSLSHIKDQLPDYKDVQHQVRNLVASEAQKVEREIDSSSEWDTIDEHIELFKSAVVLDEFVSREVTARLSTLRRLREKKEDQVDEHLQQMIEKNNFKGLADFLSPLAKSTDQLKKQKYESYQDEIVFNLDLIIDEVKRSLDQDLIAEEDIMRSVSKNMGVLNTAKASLQLLLKQKLNLAVRIRDLSGKIDDGLNPLLVQIFYSIEKKDFVHAAESEQCAQKYARHLDKFIRGPTREKKRDATLRFEEALRKVPTYVDKFSQSSFKIKDDLVRSLSSLKEAKENSDDSTKESSDDSMEKLASIYDKTQKALLGKVRGFITTVEECEAQCFDDINPLVHSLHLQVNGALKPHLPTELVLDCDKLLQRLQREKNDHDRMLEFGRKDLGQTLDLWAQELDKLESPSWYRRFNQWWSRESDKTSYRKLKNRLIAKIEDRFKLARTSLNSRDLHSVEESIDFLTLAEKKLRGHVESVGGRLNKLRKQCVEMFLGLCKQIKTMLEAKEIYRFEEKFAEYRGFLIHVPCILTSKEGKREFSLVNQMLYEAFLHQVQSFLAIVDAEVFDFSSIRSQVVRLRKLGDFFADRVTILNEEIVGDKWLGKIQDLCLEHFSNGRDFGKLKYYMELGVLPSATKTDIKKAFKAMAKRYHPDKMSNGSSSGDVGARFRKVKEAQDQLLSSGHFKSQDRSRAFDEVLKGIGAKLRTLAKRFVEEQRYDLAEKILFQLPSLKELDNLVTPKLQSREIQSSVCEIVKGHVEKMRIDVDTNWSERRYKDLNDSITDLKQMESHFKSYPKVFATSWNTGIMQTIETEIEGLGQKARSCLSSHGTAKKMESDFRRFFIEMGSVLVELPSFKAFTKTIMCNVLEACLDSAWGYSFLFELGLSLQRGSESSGDDENRIAQMLVSEFSHFKEVMTMVWNQETSQKPVEDVVQYMRGEHRKSPMLTEAMAIDQEELIQSFRLYEKQYKSMLGEYIKPDADLNALVQRVTELAQQLKPISCDKTWEENEKRKIPLLLAGVFSLFTVLKSGASYNRIEAAAGTSSLGEKLLMKPHNIQVLTLLYMFGCGKGPQSSFDSQLMQIRTGEGKSMILGAAAVVFALLGFRVRTVCYSEYLSSRDFRLFEEVFQRFGVLEDVKYSKISTYSEDSCGEKGNIRDLTESLLREKLVPPKPLSQTRKGPSQSGLPGREKYAGESINDKETQTLTKSGTRRGRSKSPKAGKKKKQKMIPAVKDCPGTGLDCKSLVANENETALDIAKGETPHKDEILLVDEVDVFFGSEFYGKTYNQVIEFNEPEVATILKRIWDTHKVGHRLRLNDIKSTSAYKTLLKKMASFGFLVDNEISLMLNQVKRVDDIPYYLDTENDRIGYKVMDSISYDVTYGYATIFAYLKEAANLKDISKALVMPVSCGQFSYANISPTRILGVSGTLEAIGDYEKDVLDKYGLDKFIFVPSVYGDSNFQFDKAGDGISFESNKSNFYHKISAEIMSATKSKRAVIVFFRDRSKLNEFVASPSYPQLGRRKSLLTEDMSSIEKEYVINKAATTGQITLSTAVFGRGTDFFCKDEGVEKNGGVHIIQTFLSEEVSEEVQIQGRTARQGKKGSFQMILLDADLESDFGISAIAEWDKIPKKEWYDWLCNARVNHQNEQCLLVEKNLEEATERDNMSHEYFDSLLAGNVGKAKEQFKNLYLTVKKPPMPSSLSIDLALVIDVTGSMAPYAQSVASTVKSLLSGRNSLITKLSLVFPEIEFQLKLSCLGFRDIDDGSNQFIELRTNSSSHFTTDVSHALSFVERICATPSGGHDLAEDILGAIHRCASWQNDEDWASDIKFMVLLSDASAHGLVPKTSAHATNADSYSVCHPEGLTTRDAVTSMLSKDVDLFFCSFNPSVTTRTEEEISVHFEAHPDNADGHNITRIPMVPAEDAIVPSSSSMPGGYGRHIIFVLDESGSMCHSWSGVVVAYNEYLSKRRQSQSDSDLVSCVQFDSVARTTVRQQSLSRAPETLSYHGGGTAFYPAALEAAKLAHGTPRSHIPAIIFMSDGQAGDASYAAREFLALNDHVRRTSSNDLELHVIAFGGGTDQAQLQQIASASRIGKVHASSNTVDLANVFVEIASTQNVATFLETEIGKRISDAVSDKLSLEYFGS